MELVGENVLLRVYLQSADRAPLAPTHERIVAAARKKGLAGATVLHGILGAGYHEILKSSWWSLAEHVPVIVEIVDSADRIAGFVRDTLDDLLVGGMLTLERAAVMMYRRGAVRRQSSSIDPIDPPPAGAGRFALAGTVRPLSTISDIQPDPHMTINENGVLVRVFIGNSDRLDGKPLHEAIVQKVRDLGLAGATVLRGTEGFGAHSILHKANLLEMSSDLPIVIEIVDASEKIELLLPHLDAMVQEGMVTIEHVAILSYRHGHPAKSAVE